MLVDEVSEGWVICADGIGVVSPTPSVAEGLPPKAFFGAVIRICCWLAELVVDAFAFLSSGVTRCLVISAAAF